MDSIKDKVSLCIDWFGEHPSLENLSAFTQTGCSCACYLGEKANKIHQTWSYQTIFTSHLRWPEYLDVIIPIKVKMFRNTKGVLEVQDGTVTKPTDRGF